MALRRLYLVNLLDLGRFYLIIGIKDFVFYPIMNGVKYKILNPNDKVKPA